MNPTETGLEVLSKRRTRKEEILLVLKKWVEVPAFKKALVQAVGARADLRALGRDELGALCRLYFRLGGVNAAVVQLTEADAKNLLRLGKMRPWLRPCVQRLQKPSRNNACWRCGCATDSAKHCKDPRRCLTCLDGGGGDVAHAARSSSCPVFWEPMGAWFQDSHQEIGDSTKDPRLG